MAFERVNQILSSRARSLRALAKAAGGDPATFYRDADLSGADLSNQDLRGMSFDRADLRNIKINYKTKADDGTLTRLREDMISQAVLSIGEVAGDKEKALLLLDIVLNYLTLKRPTEADINLQDFLSIVPVDVMAEVDPRRVALSRLPSAAEFMSRWFSVVTPSRQVQEVVKELAAVRGLPWPKRADFWVFSNFEHFEAPLVITLIQNGKADIDQITDWIHISNEAAGWADVAAWALAVNTPTRSFRNDIINAVLDEPQSLENDLIILLAALTRGVSKSNARLIGRMTPVIRGYKDLLRFSERAVERATHQQLHALDSVLRRRKVQHLVHVSRGLMELFQPGISRPQLNSYSLDYPDKLLSLVMKQQNTRRRPPSAVRDRR